MKTESKIPFSNFKCMEKRKDVIAEDTSWNPLLGEGIDQLKRLERLADKPTVR